MISDKMDGNISFSFPSTAFGGSSDVNGGFNFDLPLATAATFSDQSLDFVEQNTANNQAFLGNVISTSQENVNTTGDRAFGVQKDAFNAITDMSDDFKDIAKYSVKKKSRIAILESLANMSLQFGGMM